MTFFLLRGSILRLWRAPSLRGYPLRSISLSLSHRCEDPSSAFGATRLQGPTRFGLSLFRFHTASWIHPPPSARPFSKGLPTSGYLTFTFTPLRESILRLRRAPSLRGYSLRSISLSLSYRYDGLGSSNRKRSWMMFSMYCPTFLRLCSMSRFEKRMTRMSYFSMRLLRFSSYFMPSMEWC